jgi:hypothetical protein
LTRSTSGATVPESPPSAPGGAAAETSALARAHSRRPASGARRLAVAIGPGAVDRRGLAAVDNNSARRVIRGERHRDLVAEDDADAVLAELPAEVRENLMLVLELDAKIARRQHLDDAPLKLDMLFSAHGGADLTRSSRPGQ